MIRARTPVGPGKGDDDAALLRSQGGFIPQWSSAWRLGELFLFADKLAFAQPGKPRFELALATVTDVAMERRRFILLHKDVVRLTYVLPNQKRPRLAWFITADAGRWFDEIMMLTKAERAAAAKDATGAPGHPPDGASRPPGRAAGARASRPPDGARPTRASRPPDGARPTRASRPPDGTRPARASRTASRPAPGAEPMIVREDQVEELAATLSPAGARILWHLWERRHADIKELAAVADSRSHMEVLTLLREGINGAAERLFGHPAVEFKERGLDLVSGQVVTFQWWLERAGEPGEAGYEDGVAAGSGRESGAADVAGATWAEAESEPGGPAPQATGPAPSAAGPAEPFVEIHDEGETLVVVVMGPGVGAETVRAPQVQHGDTLLVALQTAAGRRELRVPLPCGVLAAPVTAASANRVASLTLVKETREERR